jgi:hypothetical protein
MGAFGQLGIVIESCHHDVFTRSQIPMSGRSLQVQKKRLRKKRSRAGVAITGRQTRCASQSSRRSPWLAFHRLWSP